MFVRKSADSVGQPIFIRKSPHFKPDVQAFIAPIFRTTLAYNSVIKSVLLVNPSISNTMSDLKTRVIELFEKDKELNALKKEIKVKNAPYHHLILQNTEKVYNDAEVVAINNTFEELNALEDKRTQFKTNINLIKDFLKSRLAPLAGGRWVHETEDPIHPRWEFWVEDDELKFARMNGTSY